MEKEKMRKSELKVVMVVAMFVAMLIALMLLGTRIGLPEDIDTDFWQLFPGILGIVLGFGFAVYTQGEYALFALFVVGLGFAHLSGTMWDMGLINTLMLTGLTIGQLQLWIIVIPTILGGIITALTWDR